MSPTNRFFALRSFFEDGNEIDCVWAIVIQNNWHDFVSSIKSAPKIHLFQFLTRVSVQNFQRVPHYVAFYGQYVTNFAFQIYSAKKSKGLKKIRSSLEVISLLQIRIGDTSFQQVYLRLLEIDSSIFFKKVSNKVFHNTFNDQIYFQERSNLFDKKKQYT